MKGYYQDRRPGERSKKVLVSLYQESIDALAFLSSRFGCSRSAVIARLLEAE
jgi:hypothetical protein